jgi:MFS family permease
MIGLFLPLTIYLQSVLGHTALEAGLILAPSSVMSMVLAVAAGRLSDRFGGRFILMGGLAVYALGMLWFVLVSEVDTPWTAFIAPSVVIGIGMGGVFAPMATEAMRYVPPPLAGAASGVNNTVRQVGSVLGGAVVGAVLQNRLAVSLHEEAIAGAATLPPGARGAFVDGFAGAAEGGLEVGGQSAGPRELPADVPPDVAQRVQELAGQVFAQGFVDAMKPTLLVPVVVVLVAAVACLGVRRYRVKDGEPADRPVPSEI